MIVVIKEALLMISYRLLRRSSVWFCCLFSTAFLIALPARGAAKRPFSVEDLYKIGRVSNLAVSPDQRHAAFVVKKFNMTENTAQSSIWLTSLKTGKTRRLTNASKIDRSPKWLSAEQLAFVSNRLGTSQIWSIQVSGGEAVQLTDLPVSVDNFVVASGGEYAAVQAAVFPECQTMSCNREKALEVKKSKVQARLYDRLLYRVWDRWDDRKRGHILWVPLKGGQTRDLTPGGWQTPPLDLGGQTDLTVSPDGEEIAFTANQTENMAWNTNNDIFVVPVDGGKIQNITAPNEACDAEPSYSPNGKFIAYLSMRRAGFEADNRVLTLYNRITGVVLKLTDGLDLSVMQFSWSPDSRDILFNAQERGRLALFRVSVPSGVVTKLVSENTNAEPQYFADGTEMVFLRQSLARPPEVFTSLRGGKAVKQLTHINDALFEEIEMGAYEDIEYKGDGGDNIHGFVVLPPNFQPNKKYPMLMLIHGGPQGAFSDSFHPRWNMQMFSTPGFVVVGVNFHGSVGYGQKFTDSVSGDWGGKPYKDILMAIEHMSFTYPFIDKDNVSAAGASFGGFMVNWILGHTEGLRSLVSHAGVYDQVSMYGATEELWFPEWEFKGTPWTNPELYERFSPSNFADKFRTPTLVIHGEHDYRVPYTQSLQLFTALNRQGVESKLLFFPDETHFIQKPQNARLWWHTVLKWLADHADLNWTPPIEKVQPKKPVKRIAG